MNLPFGLDAGWLWMIGGVLLLIAEILAPGLFLLFIGAAAIGVGIFTKMLGLGIAAQLALFALYAVVAVYVGKRFYAHANVDNPDPLLNDRGGRLVGRLVTVVEAVDDHGGRVRVGDSEWTARGGPAEPGQRVRIVGIDGNCLKVEAERVLPPG
jgi:membrane protein implicated in regulation of membrane protease activity